MFVKFECLEKPLEVTLGDGHQLKATGHGTAMLITMKLQQHKRKCKLHDVLHVLKLSYNVLSVSKATQFGKLIQFVGGCSVAVKL